MDQPPQPPPVCPKCRSKETTFIGQSKQPVLLYYRCDACGHVFVPQAERS